MNNNQRDKHGHFKSKHSTGDNSGHGDKHTANNCYRSHDIRKNLEDSANDCKKHNEAYAKGHSVSHLMEALAGVTLYVLEGPHFSITEVDNLLMQQRKFHGIHMKKCFRTGFIVGMSIALALTGIVNLIIR